MDRQSPAETPSRWSVSSELTLYQARGGGPAIPVRDSLSEAVPPASLRHIKQGADGPPGPSGGPRKYESEGATARSLAPTMPEGIQRRGHSRTISPESPCLSSSIRGGRASTPRSSPTTARNSGAKPSGQRLPSPTSPQQPKPPPQTPTTTQYLSGLAPMSSRGSARDLGRGIPLNREPPLKTPDTN